MIFAGILRKKSLFLTTAITASLLAGYFCLPPQAAQAMDMSGCQEAVQGAHAISGTGADSVAPCCLQKQDNAQSGAIISNASAPIGMILRNISAGTADAGNFNAQLIFREKAGLPPQPDLLASVIKIE